MAKGKYEHWLTMEGLLELEGWARDGLTDEQVDLVTELARSLQQQNKNHRVTPKSTPTPEQQELVFKVIEQFLK